MKNTLFFILCTLLTEYLSPSYGEIYTHQNGLMPITTNTLSYDPWPYLGISIYGLQAFYEDMYTSIDSIVTSSSSSTSLNFTRTQLQSNPFLYCLSYPNIHQGIERCTSLAVQKGKERISMFRWNAGNTTNSKYVHQYYDVANIYNHYTYIDNVPQFIHDLHNYQYYFQQQSSYSSSSSLVYYYFDILSEGQQNASIYIPSPWDTPTIPFPQNYQSEIQQYLGVYQIYKDILPKIPKEIQQTWCNIITSFSSSLYSNASTITCIISQTSIQKLYTEYQYTEQSLLPYIQTIASGTQSGTNLTMITTACLRSWLLASLNRTFTSPSFTTPIIEQIVDTSTPNRYTTNYPITEKEHPDIHRIRLKFAFSHLLMEAGKYVPAIHMTIQGLQSLSSIIMSLHRNIDAGNNTIPFPNIFAVEQLFFNAQTYLGYLFDKHEYPKEARESFRKSIDGLTKSLIKYQINYVENPWKVYGETLLSMRTSLALSLSHHKETIPESIRLGELLMNETKALYSTNTTNYVTAFVLNNYGYLLNQAQMYDKAEPILRNSYSMYETLDPSHASIPSYSPNYNASTILVTNTDALRALSNLATTLEQRHKFNESEYLFRIVYTNRELMYGPYHMDTIKAILNLAACLKRYGYNYKEKLTEAGNLFNLAYERKTYLYGTNDRILLNNQNNKTDAIVSDNLDSYYTLAMYAETLMENGNLTEALKIAQQAHQGVMKLAGENHSNTLMIKETIAACYHSLERTEEALELFEYILNRREELFGKNDTHSLRIRRTLGAMYVQKDNHEKAIPYLKDLIAIMEESLEFNHADTLRDTEDFTNQLFRWNKLEDAEIYQRKAYKGYVKVYGPKHEKTLRAQSNLGSMMILLAITERNKEIQTLQESGQDYLLYANPDDKEHNLEKGGIPFMRPGPVPGEDGKIPEPEEKKETVYQSEILYRKAEALLKQALAGRNETLGLANKDTIHTMTELATLYLGDENYRSMVKNPAIFKSMLGTKEKHYDAVQLFKQAVNGLLQISSTSDAETLRVMFNYASALYTYVDSTIEDKLEAIKQFRTVAEYRRLTIGKENPDTLLSFTRLGTVVLEVAESIYQKKLTADQDRTSYQEEHGRSVEEEEGEEDKEELVIAADTAEPTKAPQPDPISGPKPTPKVTVIKVSPSTKQAYHQFLLAAEEAEALGREAWEIQKIRVRNMRLSERDKVDDDDEKREKKKKKDISVQDTDNIDRSPKYTIKEIEPLRTLYIISKAVLKQKKESNYKEAEKFARMVAKSRRELLGPKHPDTKDANKLLFDILTIQGKTPMDDKQYIEAAMSYM